jgi:hypothetical protein
MKHQFKVDDQAVVVKANVPYGFARSVLVDGQSVVVQELVVRENKPAYRVTITGEAKDAIVMESWIEKPGFTLEKPAGVGSNDNVGVEVESLASDTPAEVKIVGYRLRPGQHSLLVCEDAEGNRHDIHPDNISNEIDLEEELKEFAFTFTVVGKGLTEAEAWQDAKQSAEEKVAEDHYDNAENISDDVAEEKAAHDAFTKHIGTVSGRAPEGGPDADFEG